MPDLPNPFEFAGSHSVDTAAVSSPSPVDAAAELSLAELERRGFDALGFLNDIEPLPAFLGAPSAEYLQAAELIPVLEVLAGH